MKNTFLRFFCCAVWLGLCNIAEAGGAAINVKVGEVKQVSVGGRRYTCLVRSGKSQPGTYTASTQSFLLTATKISSLKKSLRKAKNAKQKAKINKQLAGLRSTFTRATTACKTLLVKATPSPGATPTPRPTVPPSSSTCDASRINNGRSIASSRCGGCHLASAGRGLSSSALKSRVASSPMFITLSDSDAAALACYLNQ